MGFKRTPEGRVFFQGGNTPQSTSSHEMANDAPPRPGSSSQKRRPLRPDQPQQSGVSQTQIVTLLKTLNERLKLTQADRDKMMGELEGYRAVIEDLEDKADRNERFALDLEYKLEQQTGSSGQGAAETEELIQEFENTRKLLLAKQTAFEKKQSEHNKILSENVAKTATGYSALSKRIKNTEARQLEIDEKVEAAALQQSKLMRKVDKAIEDRARFMRKIERIEETVIQTRDSLNAKAMVLLTDQGVAAQADLSEEDLNDPSVLAALRSQQVEQAQAASTTARPHQNTRVKQGIFEKPFVKPAAVAASVLLIGALGAWGYNQISTPNQDSDIIASMQQLAQNSDAWQAVNVQNTEPSAGEEIADNQDLPPQNAARPIESLDWGIAQEQTAPSQDQAQNAADIATNDIGTIDLQNEEDVLALLESNPEALARELNKIEPERLAPAPQTPQEETVIAAIEPKNIEESAPATPALETAQPDPRKPVQSEAQLRKQIKSDSSLPNVVKTIEDQAFAGIPEAQHDLAAIYTAGHGGVAQDYDRASFWFKQAAENGIANASYNLGVLQHQGLGSKPDIEKALSWYERAAAQGHAEAQYNLGIAYIEGIGVKYDPVKAGEYFSSAADNGIMEAAYNLGLIYENGLLGDAKPDDALLWYKQAADQGSPEARQALEELARRLEISLEDVNRIVESMRAANDVRRGKNVSSDKEAANQIKSSTSLSNNDKQNSVLPASSTSNTGIGQALIAQVQEYLMSAGLYPGPADGVSGPLTEDAVRSYQSLSGLNANGLINENLLEHMLSNEAGLGSRAQ